MKQAGFDLAVLNIVYPRVTLLYSTTTLVATSLLEKWDEEADGNTY